MAALNWGLGHATRCIPLIKEIKAQGLEPIIASDGQALDLLKKEFPADIFEELPSYNIVYAKKGSLLKWKLLLKSLDIISTIRAERKFTEELMKKYSFDGIISDNRWGVRSKLISKNVFITHQLNVLSGPLTFLSSFIQQRYIKRFDQCWVPDNPGKKNLSGRLGHMPNISEKIKYIGPLSRFNYTKLPVKYDFLILLSGPEPQRSILETILLKEFKGSEYKILFIRGILNEEHFDSPDPNLEIKNYLFGKPLEEAINSSDYIISRSGYTTLMDLSKLQKKVFFIPTPGQEEQQYLARRMKELGYAPFCEQKDFTLSKLDEIQDYNGLGNLWNNSVLGDCLTFFQSE